MLIKIIFACLVFSPFTLAAKLVPSAHRELNEDWRSALSRSSNFVPDSALAMSFELAPRVQQRLDISAIPEWRGSVRELEKIMAVARDERVYRDGKRPRFKRRSPWLYPDDGCYARGEALSRSFERRKLTRPGKVFAFGNLSMMPAYGPRTSVMWSYHVAPAFRLGREVYVLDPVADAHHVIKLSQWLARMVMAGSSVRVAICDANAYSSAEPCRGGVRTDLKQMLVDQAEFFDAEWDQLVLYGMDPRRHLGDHPPWNR